MVLLMLAKYSDSQRKLWGRMESCATVGNRRWTGRRVTNSPQVFNPPHKHFFFAEELQH
jgi:hypothetical protein